MAADFSMVAGDTKTLLVAVDDGAGGVVSLDNVTVRWQLSRGVDEEAQVVKSSDSGGGVTILEPTDDQPLWSFEVELLPEDTEDLRGDFYHEAEVVDEVGEISTVLQGSAAISPALIRSATT